jgi:outer membrane receptor protein involved in Fe transport
VGYSWAGAESTMKVVSYTLFDAPVGYDLGKVGLKGVDVCLNANNLTNESYVASCASLAFYICSFWKSQNDKTPVCASRQGFRNSILTMTYSHMGKPHTTIGDASFHF